MKQWETKEQAITFRKQGFSYKEIMRFFPVAKGTVSNWCKDIELTSGQIRRLQERKKQGSYVAGLKGSKANQKRRAEEVRQIKENAKYEAPLLIGNSLWIAGLMLYWAEGNKSKNVGVTNSDPNVIKFMMEWFREYCNVDSAKFKFYLNLHSGQDEEEIKEFWSGLTRLPKEQFGKSYIKKEGTGHRKKILYKGTLRITICNSNLLHRILGWIEGVIDVFECNKLLTKKALIAQLVEQRPLKATVSGSSPDEGTFFV